MFLTIGMPKNAFFCKYEYIMWELSNLTSLQNLPSRSGYCQLEFFALKVMTNDVKLY